MTMHAEMLTKQHELNDDLAELAARYIELHGSAQDGMAALGEDLLRLADRTHGRTSWLGLLTQLQRLSG